MRLSLAMKEDGETGYLTLFDDVRVYGPTNKWVYIEKHFTVPANITSLSLRIESSAWGSRVGNVWWDNVSIRRVNPDAIVEIIEENNYYPFGLRHKGYNNVVNGVDHPYGFNGKEEQNEFNGTLQWLDFGARNYDPALGRWMNIDPFAKNYMKYSPYNYALNNPVINVDEGGKFVLPAHILNDPRYAKLVSYVKNDIHKVLNNKKVVNSLKKLGKFTDAQLKEAFTYGSGPEIDVKQLGTKFGEPVNGRFHHGTSVLNIDVDIIEALQNAEGLDSDAWLLILSTTILHEYVHYGDDQLEDEDKYKGEEGAAFELDAYGVNFTQAELKQAKDFIKQWLEQQRKEREEADNKRSGFNDLINNVGSLEEGTYTWNGTSWVKS